MDKVLQQSHIKKLLQSEKTIFSTDDFRLIFAAVSGLALMSLTPAGVLQKLTQGSLIIGLWSTFSFGVQIYPTISIAPSFVLIQFIGDLALGIFSAFLALKLIKLYRNQLFSQQNNQD